MEEKAELKRFNSNPFPDDWCRCDVDGDLVRRENLAKHLGHHIRQPVKLSLKERLLWTFGLIQ